MRFADVLLTIGLNIRKDQVLIIFAEGEAADMVPPLCDMAAKRGVDQVWIDSPTSPCQDLPQNILEKADIGQCTLVYLSAPYTQQPALHGGCHLSREGLRQAYAQGKMSYVKSVYPTSSWACRVYPELGETYAQEALRQAFVRFSYLDSQDPIQDWRQQQSFQEQIKKGLEASELVEIHFKGAGNDCYFRLLEGCKWLGGSSTNPFNGQLYLPNIPSIEIFTVPDRMGTRGILRSSKPLVFQGQLIEEIVLEFSQGQVIRASAGKGEAQLQKILQTDQGASYLGELALVPVSSPMGETGRIFYDTLLDENAACHVALGKGTPAVLPDHYHESVKSLQDRGINHSSLHVDIVVGTSDLDVTGLDKFGRTIPLMDNGEWVIEGKTS